MPQLDWDDETRQEWTDRVVNRARQNSTFYQGGNRESEDLVQSASKYKVANPTINVTGQERKRSSTSGSEGALADMTRPTEDAASITYLDIEVVGSQLFPVSIDQRDLPYFGPVTLGSLRDEIVYESGRWVDRTIITHLIGDSSLVTAASSDTANALFDISANRIAGNDAQVQALGKQLLDWMDDAVLHLGANDFVPEVAGAGGDVFNRARATMTVWHWDAIRRYLLDTYDAIPEIVLRNLRTVGGIIGAGYRGTYRDAIDIVVSNSKSGPTSTVSSKVGSAEVGLVPRAATDTGHGASNLLRAFLTIPENSYDAALVTYPMAESEPSGTSAKYWMQQELELWAGVVNPDARGLFRQFTITAQA